MDYTLPQLGEGVYEAELIRWLVKPGDAVKRGQSMLEVMTDKATMEVPAPFAGTINSVTGEPGQRIKVGEVMDLRIDLDNCNRVIARIRVASEVPVKTDTEARLEPIGLTGVTLIQLSPGSAGADACGWRCQCSSFWRCRASTHSSRCSCSGCEVRINGPVMAMDIPADSRARSHITSCPHSGHRSLNSSPVMS